MGSIRGWLCGWDREQALLLAGFVGYSTLFVATVLALVCGLPAVSVAIGLVAAAGEFGVRRIRRVRLRDRTDRFVVRLIGDQLSDAGLQQVLDCWSKRYRRQ